MHLDFNTRFYENSESLTSILDINLMAWEHEFNIEKISERADDRFKFIIQSAYEKTGKQEIVLIDEYDKPLLQTMNTNAALNETYRSILKAFFGLIKSSDQYLRFAFLAGVTKSGKVSVFSDLNNLQDISMLPAYAEICGISQSELESNFAPDVASLAKANICTIKAAI